MGGQAKNMHLMHKKKGSSCRNHYSSPRGPQSSRVFCPTGQGTNAPTEESEVKPLSTWWERNPGSCSAANNHNLTETAKMEPGPKTKIFRVRAHKGQGCRGTECEGAEKLDSVILVIGFLFILSC